MTSLYRDSKTTAMMKESRSNTMFSRRLVHNEISRTCIIILLWASLLPPAVFSKRASEYKNTNRKDMAPDRTHKLSNSKVKTQDDDSVLGSCWSTVSSTGHCSELLAENITRSECCTLANREGHPTAGWSDHAVLTSKQYFYWVLVQKHGPMCQLCQASCKHVNCGTNKVCRLRGSKVQCVCSIPECSRRFRREMRKEGPVCGFDGKTYKNRCTMLRRHCKKNIPAPHVDYQGKCQISCSKVRCSAFQNCVLDQNSLPHCIQCEKSACPNTTDPSKALCGGDGLTYTSLCHLERETCQLGKAIKIAYSGVCKEGLTCKNLQCENKDDRCLRDVRTGLPQCHQCTRPCPVGQSRQPLCGSDGRTYHGWCHMMETSCLKGIVIDAQHFGRCKNKD